MIYAERLSQYAKKRRQKYMCRKVRKMGLTNTSTGLYAKDSGLVIKKRNYDDKVIALAGNPNVGKSTLSVSYTHLDVYKRQPLGSPTKGVPSGLCISHISLATLPC